MKPMKPMLCTPLSIDDAHKLVANEGYIVEEKFDGVRAYIEDGKLFDRRGADITKRFPEFTGIERLNGFDGELVVAKGQFSDVASRMHLRDKFQIGVLSKRSPVTFMAFDYFAESDEPLSQRKKFLSREVAKAAERWLKDAEFSVASPNNLEEMWDRIIEERKEGVVIKRLDSTYQFGKRSPEWVKMKAWTEATATFTKLAEHPKGVRLETADGRSVNVNGAQAQDVKKRFEKAGKVTCEVQFLPQKDSDAWRFPSFRGIRAEE